MLKHLDFARFFLGALALFALFGCDFQAPSQATPKGPRNNQRYEEEGAPYSVAARRDTKPYSAPNPNDPKIKLERYLIIHADDVGLCDSVNRATIDGLEQGIISSASIMVPCPKFEDFARYAAEHPQYDYGIHLTLNAEFQTYRWGPVLGAEAVPSLVNSDGHFWQESHETEAHAKANEVERELTAQIDRALELKIPLSHLDTHMGTLYTRRDLTEIYVNLAVKYKLPILMTRGGRDINEFPIYRNLMKEIDEMVASLDKHGLPVLDHLVMRYTTDPVSVKRNMYSAALRNLPQGVSELIVHVGYDDRDLRRITMSPEIRDGDRQVLMNPALADFISKLGIKIISWKQFQKMKDENKLPAPPKK